MAQVCGLGPRVGGRLALFCIHRVNRLYGAIAVTSRTCYGACRIIIIIIIFIFRPSVLNYYYYYYSNQLKL